MFAGGGGGGAEFNLSSTQPTSALRPSLHLKRVLLLDSELCVTTAELCVLCRCSQFCLFTSEVAWELALQCQFRQQSRPMACSEFLN
jgi:hypothetical protein